MVRLDEKILDYIRRAGPSTPIEVAQRIGSDSLIVSAILVDAATQQKIKRSKRRAGDSRYFYYPEQLGALQKRINDRLTPQDKEMVQKILNEKVMCELTVPPQQVSILSGLEDLIRGFTFEYNNKIVRGWSSPNIAEEKAREDVIGKLDALRPREELKPVAVIAPKPRIEEIKPSVKEAEVKKKIPRSWKSQKSRKKGRSPSQKQNPKSQGKSQKSQRKIKLRKSSRKR